MSNDGVDIYEYSVKLRFSPKFWKRISQQVEQLLYSDVADYIIEAIELKLMSDEDFERGGGGATVNVPAGLVLAVTLALFAATAIFIYEVLSVVFGQDLEPARLIMPAPVIMRPLPTLA